MKMNYIRLRTWSLTGVLVIAVAFYLIMSVAFNEEVDIINLILLSAITITIHFIYFPDGERCGESDLAFISNKKAYNARASAVNTHGAVKELREFCKQEFNERLNEYIRTECGKIGITYEEYTFLTQKSPNEIKKIESFEYEGKLIFITKENRKTLYNLLFKRLPVEENNANSILSARDIDITKAISDESKSYKTVSHIQKCIIGIGASLFFAFVGYTFRGGITIETIALFITYIANMLITAVFSFSRGETCQKVHKCKYYLELSIFLDCFIEWLKPKKEIIIQEQP